VWAASSDSPDLPDDATRNLAYQHAIAEGERYEQQQDYAQAVQAFERALRLDPLNRDAATRLVRVKEAQKTRELMIEPQRSETPPMITTSATPRPARPSWLRRLWARTISPRSRRASRSTHLTPENLERQLQQVESAIAVTKEQQAALAARLASRTAQLKAREADAHTLDEQLKNLETIPSVGKPVEEPLELSGQGRTHIPDIDPALGSPR